MFMNYKLIFRFFRLALFPFSILYGFVMSIRNLFFDWGFFSSRSFSVPVIAVGNLSVGGTGKTPQIAYLIHLLQKDFKVAVLSRGYKRKSKGFVLASSEVSVEEFGDEPYFFYKKLILLNTILMTKVSVYFIIAFFFKFPDFFSFNLD